MRTLSVFFIFKLKRKAIFFLFLFLIWTSDFGNFGPFENRITLCYKYQYLQVSVSVFGPLAVNVGLLQVPQPFVLKTLWSSLEWTDRCEYVWDTIKNWMQTLLGLLWRRQILMTTRECLASRSSAPSTRWCRLAGICTSSCSPTATTKITWMQTTWPVSSTLSKRYIALPISKYQLTFCHESHFSLPYTALKAAFIKF